jgi:dihydropteroate synthase
MTALLTNAASTAERALQLPGGRKLVLDQSSPLVMGILNLTPDSFSDGGRWEDSHAAVDRALEMLEQGAAIVDLGAESTRPGGGVYGDGAGEVTVEEELARLLPALERLREATDAPISIDTRKAAVADAALRAGADLINDISALSDTRLAAATAAAGCPVVLMHSRGKLATMQRDIQFGDVVAEVRAELEQAMLRAMGAGIERDQIIIDPGIGFGKTAAQNLELLHAIDSLARLAPVLIGASRKSFIGNLTGAPVESRLPGSLAAAAWAAQGGASFLRVHDVAETVQFLSVWREIAARSTGS